MLTKNISSICQKKEEFFSRKQFSLFSLSQIRKEKERKKKRNRRKSWLVLNLTCTLLNYKSLNFSPLFFFVTVCNFVVHDRCLKAVVSPCSSIAASLIKVRIPTISVPPLFRATRDEVWILPSATYIYTPLRILRGCVQSSSPFATRMNFVSNISFCISDTAMIF